MCFFAVKTQDRINNVIVNNWREYNLAVHSVEDKSHEIVYRHQYNKLEHTFLQQLLLHRPWRKISTKTSNGSQMTQQHVIINEVVFGIHKNHQGI